MRNWIQHVWQWLSTCCPTEEEAGPITLETVLEFASGASAVPPPGFPHQPEIQILHEGNKIFPEANTCLLVLHLPMHSSYEAFKKYMTQGILQAPTFGSCIICHECHCNVKIFLHFCTQFFFSIFLTMLVQMEIL